MAELHESAESKQSLMEVVKSVEQNGLLEMTYSIRKILKQYVLKNNASINKVELFVNTHSIKKKT